MEPKQTAAQKYAAEMQQRDWAELIIGPPQDIFEKKCLTAIEADPRIKVIGLAIREMTPHDFLVTQFYNMKFGDVLFFRFKCPCGDTITEVMALGDNWVPRFPQLLADLEKNTWKHLQSEGFVL